MIGEDDDEKYKEDEGGGHFWDKTKVFVFFNKVVYSLYLMTLLFSSGKLNFL